MSVFSRILVRLRHLPRRRHHCQKVTFQLISPQRPNQAEVEAEAEVEVEVEAEAEAEADLVAIVILQFAAVILHLGTRPGIIGAVHHAKEPRRRKLPTGWKQPWRV